MTTLTEPVAEPAAASGAADAKPPEENPPVPVSGILDVRDKNAFVRAMKLPAGPRRHLPVRRPGRAVRIASRRPRRRRGALSPAR